jgi:hypothetical protein
MLLLPGTPLLPCVLLHRWLQRPCSRSWHSPPGQPCYCAIRGGRCASGAARFGTPCVRAQAANAAATEWRGCARGGARRWGHGPRRRGRGHWGHWTWRKARQLSVRVCKAGPREAAKCGPHDTCLVSLSEQGFWVGRWARGPWRVTPTGTAGGEGSGTRSRVVVRCRGWRVARRRKGTGKTSAIRREGRRGPGRPPSLGARFASMPPELSPPCCPHNRQQRPAWAADKVCNAPGWTCRGSYFDTGVAARCQDQGVTAKLGGEGPDG